MGAISAGLSFYHFTAPPSRFWRRALLTPKNASHLRCAHLCFYATSAKSGLIRDAFQLVPLRREKEKEWTRLSRPMFAKPLFIVPIEAPPREIPHSVFAARGQYMFLGSARKVVMAMEVIAGSVIT